MTSQNQQSPVQPADSGPTTFAGWLWFGLKAAEIRLRFILILVGMGLVIGFWDTITNYWEKWTRTAVTASGLGDGKEFYCPMHPNVVRPGLDPDGSVPDCPVCGMPLAKRNKGEPIKLRDGTISRTQLSPDRIQAAGIETVSVEQRPMVAELRTLGTIEYDESKMSRIVARVEGYLEKLYVNESFKELREGEPLAEIYSPQLYTAAQELLLARSVNNEQLVALAREKLRLLRIDDQEIDAILRAKNNKFQLTLRSPRAGHLLRKEVVEGDKVMPGQVLFEVADLSEMRLEIDIYERDLSLVKPGMKVEARVEGFPDRVFLGGIELIHPHLQGDQRTARVRARLDNSDHSLRQGMYATVRIVSPLLDTEPFHTKLVRGLPPAGTDKVTLASFQKVCPVTSFKLGSMGDTKLVKVGGRDVLVCCDSCAEPLLAKPAEYLARLSTVSEKGVLAVPERAVIDTGEQKIVYVEREPGTYEGVEVKLGPRSGGYYSVVEGLLPGDRVATSGAFLIDAETRLNPAASAAYFGASGGPQGAKAGATTTEGAKTGPRKAPTTADLAQIAKLPEADRKLATEQANCPITGEPLGSMGVPVKLILDGKRVFLCCKGCVKQAEGDPKKTLQTIEGWKKKPAIPDDAPKVAALKPVIPSRKLPSTEDLKNIAKLQETDRKAATAQATCPVTDEPLGSMGVPIKVMLGGKSVYLCCKGCVRPAQADAKQVLQKVESWLQEVAPASPPAAQKK